MQSEINMDVKTAVTVARSYLGEVFPESSTNLQLEEVEFIPSSGGWLITLSYLKPGHSSIIGALAAELHPREYKVVHIDADGTPLSIKMRRDVA